MPKGAVLTHKACISGLSGVRLNSIFYKTFNPNIIYLSYLPLAHVF